MGCNCKKNQQVLNNLNSNDHLKIAFTAYEEVVSKKSVEQYDEFDTQQVTYAYHTIYPNSREELTITQLAANITNIYNQQHGRKK